MISACICAPSDEHDNLYVTLLMKPSAVFCECMSKCVARSVLRHDIKEDATPQLPVWLIDIIDNLSALIAHYRKDSLIVRAGHLDKISSLNKEIEDAATKAFVDFGAYVQEQAIRCTIPEDSTVLSLTSGVCMCVYDVMEGSRTFEKIFGMETDSGAIVARRWSCCLYTYAMECSRIYVLENILDLLLKSIESRARKSKSLSNGLLFLLNNIQHTVHAINNFGQLFPKSIIKKYEDWSRSVIEEFKTETYVMDCC